MPFHQDIFKFRDELIAEYERFSRSFANPKAADIRDRLDEEYGKGRYWKDPLVQINPNYRKADKTVQQLAAAGEPTAISLEENFSLFITGPKRSGRTNLLKFLARLMLARGAEVHVIGGIEWMTFARETGVQLHTTNQEIIDFTHHFADTILKERTPLKRAAKQEGKAALRKMAEGLSPYTIIVDNAQRFNTDFNALELGQELKFLRDIYAQLCANANYYNVQLFFSAPFTASAYFMQEPLKSLVSQGRGISLGGKVSECNPLGIANLMPASHARQPLPLGQGYLITEGKVRQVVIPMAGAGDE